MLTLTGPGGVGKTRLALEAARAVELDFADGAHFVSLAAVQRPQDVPAAIVSSLAIMPLAGESAEQAVERFLAAKHLLLVVDNCEHLPGAAAFIGGLAAACPTVTVLATSREPLAVQAEHCYPVPPLALPEPGADSAAVADVDAVALFCERARAHDPDFDCGGDSSNAIAEICRRVDGLPLAIELAAARCGLLSPAEIAARLHGALDGLGAGPRDAPARQQTLRATIDWSHDLLGDDEKACFARFAVFAGGATVEAAETITGADIDTLDRLVAKSLLVRRHAGTRTHPAGDARNGPRLRRRALRGHCRPRIGARAPLPLLPRRWPTPRNRSGALRPEPRRAPRGSRRRGREPPRRPRMGGRARTAPSRALELCAALGRLLDDARPLRGGGATGSSRRCSKPDAAGDPALRARALCRGAGRCGRSGARAEARRCIAEAEAIARTLPDAAILAVVLSNRAALESYGRPARTSPRRSPTRRSPAREPPGDPWTIAMARLGASAGCAQRRELRERVDRGSVAAGSESATPTTWRTCSTCRRPTGRCATAAIATRASSPAAGDPARARSSTSPYLWMLLRGNAGLAALLIGDTEAASDAFREAARRSAASSSSRPSHPTASPASPRSRQCSTTTSTAPRGSRAPRPRIATASLQDSRSTQARRDLPRARTDPLRS